MTAARPYWKGYLKLSLVSCPIALYTGTTTTERVSFRQINKKTGNRLRQQLVDEVTREPVESEDKGRGYEVDKGVFIQVEDEEIEALREENPDWLERERETQAEVQQEADRIKAAAAEQSRRRSYTAATGPSLQATRLFTSSAAPLSLTSYLPGTLRMVQATLPPSAMLLNALSWRLRDM